MIIIRFAEIGLKGKNRAFFEKSLVKNIKSCLDYHEISYGDITRPHGRILISTDDSCNCLQCVFGIASFSNAVNAGFSMDSVKQKALEFAKDLTPEKSFRITCQRLDKNFPVNSNEFQSELGAFIQEKTNAQVRMKDFDLNIYAEIIDGFVYLFTEKIQGLGGLPVGVAGKVIILIEDEKSILAGLQMLKRGCYIVPVALKQAGIDLLQKYSFGYKLELMIINDVSEIDSIAREKKAKAVVVNDLLDSMREFELETRVLRPLIAYEPKEIKEELDAFRQRVC